MVELMKLVMTLLKDVVELRKFVMTLLKDIVELRKFVMSLLKDIGRRGGLMVSVHALAGDIVLCSWARHFTLTVPFSTQVYKGVPVNLMLGGNPTMD